MKERRNGGGALDREPSPDLPGPTDAALKDHVFKDLPPDAKLDTLLALYSGVASNVEDLRMSIANRDVELGYKLGQLDYLVRCQKLVMEALHIPAPTEPPPPPPPPSRRRRDR